jgi:hypothetical protein
MRQYGIGAAMRAAQKRRLCCAAADFPLPPE